jgi:hypothetical protein
VMTNRVKQAYVFGGHGGSKVENQTIIGGNSG